MNGKRIFKNDTAWNKLFEKYNILSNIDKNGFYEISAAAIREYREPRLMCKFDHKNNLPRIFRENDLSILPLSRSKYVIGRFDIFEKVRYQRKKPITVSIPEYIETIDKNNLYSESAALNCAYASGMIHYLLEEKYFDNVQNVFPTVSGRMGSGDFSFLVKSQHDTYKNININGSQIEIDGGYESQKDFAIVEAKKESVTDFNLRQLFYPYRVWQDKINKEVKPIFFTFSNDVFSFFLYEFENKNIFNSARLIDQIDFVVSHEKITVNDLQELRAKVEIKPEPEIPFPQADNFYRVIDLLGILMDKSMLYKDFITENYNFDERQTNYYTDIGRYLGLIKKDKDSKRRVYFTLTNLGKNIMSMPYKQKYLAMAQRILEHEIFYRVFVEFFMKEEIDRNRVIQIMQECGVYNVKSYETIRRRASTVIAYIKWIFSLVD